MGAAAAPTEPIGIRVVVVLLTIQDEALRTLLVSLGDGLWSLPAGEPGYAEPLQQAAERIVRDQLGFEAEYLEQLYTFGSHIPRNRQRTISVAYYALVPSASLQGGGGFEGAAWFGETDQPKLVDGHATVISVARERLRGKLAYTAVGFELLPEEFTRGELQELYEIILGRRLDKRNFHKKVEALGILEETGGRRKGPRGPQARLYRFRPEVFDNLSSRGDVLAF